MMDAPLFSGRLALQQRVLPAYRAAFFDTLARRCRAGLSVFAGAALPLEHIAEAQSLEDAELITARNTHFSHPGSPLYQCWQGGIIAWLKTWDPQALIVEANPRYPSTRQAIRWMKAQKRPVVGWGLGAVSAVGLLGAWRVRSRRAFLEKLDAIISYSQAGAEQYRALGFPAERVFVAPNAVAPRPNAPPPPRPQDFVGRPSVLFVGRLQARKRIDNLLRACAALPEDLQPELAIVGDGPARAEFELFAAEIYPRAVFTGAKFGDELGDYFARADLFVLPGTGGLAVQQAMSYALPVIVAQGDGTQSDLVRPENGWQIPPDAFDALVGALENALADPTRLRRMGAASYRIVDQEVNIDRMAEVFVEAVNSLP